MDSRTGPHTVWWHWPHTPLTHTGMTEALVTVLHTKDALTDSDSRVRFTPPSFHQPVWKEAT